MVKNNNITNILCNIYNSTSTHNFFLVSFVAQSTDNGSYKNVLNDANLPMTSFPLKSAQELNSIGLIISNVSTKCSI